MNPWCEKIRELPDLMRIADAVPDGDRYAIMEKLKWDFEAAWRPYVWSVPYRNPPSPCSAGDHTVPSLQREIIRPGRVHRRTLKLSERQLHEVECHGASFDAEQLKALEVIFG